MTKSAHVTLKNTLIGLGIVLALISVSGFRAYQNANEYIREGIQQPFYGIRFVLHPNRYIDGAPQLGFRPGWVVTYAPRSKNYGTGVFVSLFGSILGSGIPNIVSKERQQARRDIERFQQRFARVDAAIHVGMTFSSAAAVLRRVPPSPLWFGTDSPETLTNSDGTIDAFYGFTPRASEHIRIDWLTNGITLQISNGIVIGKSYGYSSFR